MASATNSFTLSNWGALLMGPSLVSGSVPSPTLVADAWEARASTTSSYRASGTYTRLIAEHTWPLLLKAPAKMALATQAGSASSSTMAGSLPPSSRDTRLRSGAADWATFFPVSMEPVKVILRGTGWPVIQAPRSSPPLTTFSTPGGTTERGSAGRDPRVHRARPARRRRPAARPPGRDQRQARTPQPDPRAAGDEPLAARRPMSPSCSIGQARHLRQPRRDVTGRRATSWHSGSPPWTVK